MSVAESCDTDAKQDRDYKARSRAAQHQEALEAAHVRALAHRAAVRLDEQDAAERQHLHQLQHLLHDNTPASPNAVPSGSIFPSETVVTVVATSTTSGASVTPQQVSKYQQHAHVHHPYREPAKTQQQGHVCEAGAGAGAGDSGPAVGGGGDERFIASELAEVRSKVPSERLRSCTRDSMQVLVSASRARTALLKAFFPSGYPGTPLAVQLEAPRGGGVGGGGGGSFLSDELLAKLQTALDSEVRKHTGGRQVLHAVHWLHDCLAHNRLAAAYEEIRQLRAIAAGTCSGGPNHADITTGGATVTGGATADGSSSEKSPALLSASSSRRTVSDHATDGPTTSCNATALNSNNKNNSNNDNNNIPITTTTTTSVTTNTSNGFNGVKLELRTVKERSGVVEASLSAGSYFLLLRALIPEHYPEQGVELLAIGGNLPDDMVTGCLAGAADVVRRLAEPPKIVVRTDVARAGAGTGGGRCRRGPTMSNASEAKAAAIAAAAAEGEAAREAARAAAAAAHEPRPSLLAGVRYMAERCVGTLGAGRCAVCGRRLLPGDPTRLGEVPADMRVLRLAGCGHFVHHRCIESFLSAPPFGRSGCPAAGCGERIAHHRLVTEPQVLEGRWAAKQARQREIEDAASIMGL